MKKILSITMAIAILCGICAVSVGAEYGEELPLSAFDSGQDSLSSMLMWVPSDYHERLNTDTASVLHEMFITFRTGRIEGDEYQRIVDKYNLGLYYGCIYYLDEVQQTFNATFNTNIDFKALNGLKFKDSDIELITIRDGYFFVNFAPHGTLIGARANKGYRLNEKSEYWIWYYETPEWNREEDCQDWWKSEPFYMITTDKVVAGYNIKAIDYISSVPPAEEVLSKYRNAEPSITVTLNDNNIYFDQSPIIQNDRTLVPMRAIFEAMGCEVQWNGEYQAVDVWRGEENVMTLWIGDNEMWTPNGNITLDIPPQVINDRTLVPVRAISESMGAKVFW